MSKLFDSLYENHKEYKKMNRKRRTNITYLTKKNVSPMSNKKAKTMKLIGGAEPTNNGNQNNGNKLDHVKIYQIIENLTEHVFDKDEDITVSKDQVIKKFNEDKKNIDNMFKNKNTSAEIKSIDLQKKGDKVTFKALINNLKNTLTIDKNNETLFKKIVILGLNERQKKLSKKFKEVFLKAKATANDNGNNNIEISKLDYNTMFSEVSTTVNKLRGFFNGSDSLLFRENTLKKNIYIYVDSVKNEEHDTQIHLVNYMNYLKQNSPPLFNKDMQEKHINNTDEKGKYYNSISKYKGSKDDEKKKIVDKYFALTNEYLDFDDNIFTALVSKDYEHKMDNNHWYKLNELVRRYYLQIKKYCKSSDKDLYVGDTVYISNSENFSTGVIIKRETNSNFNSYHVLRNIYKKSNKLLLKKHIAEGNVKNDKKLLYDDINNLNNLKNKDNTDDISIDTPTKSIFDSKVEIYRREDLTLLVNSGEKKLNKKQLIRYNDSMYIVFDKLINIKKHNAPLNKENEYNQILKIIKTNKEINNFINDTDSNKWKNNSEK